MKNKTGKPWWAGLAAVAIGVALLALSIGGFMLREYLRACAWGLR